MKLLSYNKKIIKLMSMIIIFLAILLLQSKSKAIQIQGGYYKVDEENKIISRIEPETTVEKFKKKIIDDENKIKIYKEKECNNEVTDGFVGTEMYVKENENLYQLSVVGDFDGDGKATQVELTNTIRHIVGLKDSKLEGIKYISADITGDEQVDQRDITKFIRYIVFGELDLGKNDTTPPTLELTTVKQMSNEITIKVTAQDNESGLGENPIYVFYVRKANETEDKNVKFYEGTNTQVELKNLEQNTNYIITATAKDKAGNEGRTSMQALTAKIPDGTEQGAIIFGNTQWKNQKASVEISTNIKRDDFASEEGTVDGKYNIEYQVNGTNGNWQKSEQEKITVTDLKNGDIVYARLTDGINSSSYISKNILDEVSPRIDIEVIEDNQNKQITAKVVNAQDNESGLEENPRYKFYIKETNEPDSAYVEKQNTIEKTYIFKNLNVNTKYTIKAEVKDKAGNIGIAEKIIDIKEITDVQAPTVDLEIINQTTNGAKVKATATDEGGLPTPTIYKFYIKEKDKADSTYREVQSTESNICDITGLKQNTNYTIKVTVEDKAGNVGEKEKDLLTKTITDITTEGAITFEGPVWNDKKAQVTIKTNTEYYIEYQVNGIIGEWTKGTNAGSDVIVSGLKNNDVIYARLTDGINNSNYTVLTIVDGIEPEDFNVTVSNITNDGFTISGSTTDNESGIKDYTYVVKSSDGTETKYENKTETSYTVTGLEEGTEYTVYMVAYDNAGNEKKSTEQKVTTIDKKAPTIDLEIINQTTNGVKVKATATDEVGLATPTIYKFYIKEKDKADSTYREVQSTESNICDITGLKQNTNYIIKVTVEDKFGNIGEKEKDILTGTVTDLTSANVTFSYSPSGWTNGSVTATASTTVIGYTLQTSKDGTNWNSTSSQTFNANGTIYARLYDGTNYGGSATGTVSNIEQTAPSASISLSSTTTDTSTGITATVRHSDSQSGVKIASCKWVYNTTSTEIGTSASSYPNTFSSNGQNITLNTIIAGTYYLHVLTTDNAGNVKETISNAVTVNLKLTKSNVYYYLGKVVTNYTGKNEVTMEISPSSKVHRTFKVSQTYRLYYVDFDNKYGDGKGTIYLKADGINIVTNGGQDTSANTATNIKIKALNPSLYASGVTAPDASNENMKTVTWLTNTTNWDGLKDSKMTSYINYVVGSPSLELMIDSYNTHYKLSGTTPDYSTITEGIRKKLFYKYTSGGTGYQVGPFAQGSKQYSNYTSYNSVYTDSAIDPMYYPGELGVSARYWLASPSAMGDRYIMSVIPDNGGRVSSTFSGEACCFCPVVSLKSNFPLQLE